MKRSTIVCLIVAVSLMALGAMVFVVGMTMKGFSFSNTFTTARLETLSYDIEEKFDDIKIISNTADINFYASDNDSAKVVCYEDAKLKYDVSVTDGTLTITLSDERRWYDHITFFSPDTNVDIYLPAGEYGALSINTNTSDIDIPEDFTFTSLDIDLTTGDVDCSASVKDTFKIKATTGNLKLSKISAASVDLKTTTGRIAVTDLTCEGDVSVKVSTGKTIFNNVACKNLISTGGTGDVKLKGVIATEKFDIKRSTGDVEFDRCDAAEITIVTDTGEVEGSLLTEKIFFVKTDTGDVDVPRTTTGGTCDITTDTGDIEIYVIG